MKKSIILFVCLLAILFSIGGPGNESIDFNQLPRKAQQLVEEYFPNQSMALIKVDKELFYISYEVIFTNGCKIEFDKRGRWKRIQNRYVSFPLEVIPEQIRNQISKKYIDIQVSYVERDKRNKYEIGLSDGTNLKFDSQFKLIE